MNILEPPDSDRKVPGGWGYANARRSHGYLGDSILVSTQVAQVGLAGQIPEVDRGIVTRAEEDTARHRQSAGGEAWVWRWGLVRSDLLVGPDIP